MRATVAKRFPQAAVSACRGDARGWTVTLTDAKGQRHVLALTDDGRLTADNGNDPDRRSGWARRVRIAR